jgi:hypothetical protein
MKKGDKVTSVVTWRKGKVLGLNYNGIHQVCMFEKDTNIVYDYEHLQHKEMKLIKG